MCGKGDEFSQRPGIAMLIASFSLQSLRSISFKDQGYGYAGALSYPVEKCLIY
jgi:hypothetical protein